MTPARSGVPRHGNGAAFVRLRRENLADGPYEIICPGCGDDPNRDWSEISEELRRIRGIYATKASAEAALRDHIGMQTR